jgi:peptide/nickel transport system substrate-binding protein
MDQVATSCSTQRQGQEPFKDVRSAKPSSGRVDVELIKTRVMRGLSTPSALMISPLLFTFRGLHPTETRSRRRQEALTEAAIPTGFESRWTVPTTAT